MKKIIFSLAVLAIAATVALNVNLSAQKSGDVSALALANIEALANGESINEILYSYPCKRGQGAQCIPFNGVTGPTCTIKYYC